MTTDYDKVDTRIANIVFDLNDKSNSMTEEKLSLTFIFSRLPNWLVVSVKHLRLKPLKELIFFIIALPEMTDGIQQVSIFLKLFCRNFVSLKRCFLRIESTWTMPITFCWWVALTEINKRCS
jgi:hypothetical protein